MLNATYQDVYYREGEYNGEPSIKLFMETPLCSGQNYAQ